MSIWIKVVGFSDAERHSLNTLFRLSRQHGPSYFLWSLDAPSPAQVILVDVDSYQADLELVSPNLSPHIKIIAVGSYAPSQAWHTLPRPVDWGQLIQVLDELFNTDPDIDMDFDFEDTCVQDIPAGVKNALIIGMDVSERLYLRTRLALAGVMLVDDVPTVEAGRARLAHRNYTLALLGIDEEPELAWTLVQQLAEANSPAESLIVITRSPTWAVSEKAEELGCIGVLEVPFVPQQVWVLMQKI